MDEKKNAENVQAKTVEVAREFVEFTGADKRVTYRLVRARAGGHHVLTVERQHGVDALGDARWEPVIARVRAEPPIASATKLPVSPEELAETTGVLVEVLAQLMDELTGLSAAFDKLHGLTEDKLTKMAREVVDIVTRQKAKKRPPKKGVKHG